MIAQRAPGGMKAFAALLLTTTAALADDRAPIHLSVRGAIDAGVVAERLAAELAMPVVAGGDPTCAAPCVSVVIADSSATVLYTGAGGTTRARTLELGTERAQWPTLVTLLAGNLVRDEAAELLPDDVAPPAATPGAILAPPPPPAPPAQGSPFMLGLVPGLSTDLVDLDRTHRVSIGLVASASGGASLDIAGAIGVAQTRTGVQIAGAAAFANRAATQIAGAVGVASHADVQLAGALAVATDVRFQAAGAIAIAHTADAQIAGAANIAHTAASQIAGALNIAGTASTQIAGALNIASHVRGLQLAPINLASRVDGVQVGVINVGGGPDDESFGLVNIVPGGRTDLEVAVDSDRIGTLTFRHGGKHWHNVYGVGAQYERDSATEQVWLAGLGLGATFHVLGAPVDLEGLAWQVNHGKHFDTDHINLLDQLRLTVSFPVGPAAIAVGAALNIYVTSDHSSPLYSERTTDPTPMTDTTVTIWPSVFVGARL